MNEIEWRRGNLNLLPVLEALVQTGSVTAAARRLHVSQSAVSHSLARLRALLDDPLLVPAGRALVPTPRAAQLAGSLPAALDALERALAPAQPFDPLTTRRVFRVATLDYFEFVLIADVMAHLRVHAPHAEIWVERVGEATLPALLAGELDLALVGETSLGRHPGILREELYQEPFAVMLRAGHPALGRRRALSLAAYLAWPHVVVTVEGRADGAVDRALELRGARRRVVLRVPHFATAPLAVLSSDALCTIARRVGERASVLYPIALREPPIELPSPAVCAVWSRRSDSDEGARWLRGLFRTGGALALK